jgi:iron complex outermembrane recepter protein
MRVLTVIFSLISLLSQAQSDSLKSKDLAEVVVNATRASEFSGMAFNNVTKTKIQKQNLGQDMPFLLNSLPSVVVNSDAGTGIGYTGIRIRGTDPTRINVTLNGIPYNDSESQGVYWVNMPDMASSVQSIQVQRGVGTSTNGAGAFGGSINVNTMVYNTEPFAEIQSSAGSFGTLRNTLSFSTGMLQNKFVLDARLSKINSEGFVDRASADLKSFYVSGGYYGKSSFARLNIFSGADRTYQSWNGIPEALAKGDKAGITDFVERNYYDAAFEAEMLKSGRKFNFYNYKNEVDNYAQTHYQLISSFKIAEKWHFNPSLHYTKGMGYFEQYKTEEKLKKYGILNYSIGNELITYSDLIRRKWLDNDFYGAVWSMDNGDNAKLNIVFGGGINQYLGGHYGEVIWAANAEKLPLGYKYYESKSTKNDFNTYGKLTWSASSKFKIYADLQYRKVYFSMNGLGDARQSLAYDKGYLFFNPKAGITYLINANSNVFFSYAKGSKEPSRQDFVDNAPILPKAEQLNDFEAGYKFNSRKIAFELNAYTMLYRDQLVLSGQVNQVGEAIRVNVPNSSRKGLEAQIELRPNQKFTMGVNATLSKNIISKITQNIVSYDDTLKHETEFMNTNISFSPSVIAGGVISFLPISTLEISLLPKYVGKQYLDNTSSEMRKLDAYFVNDLRIIFSPKVKNLKALSFSVLINNVLNVKYQSNGYTYAFISEEKRIDENFVFPQAGINFLGGVKIRL